MKAEPYDQIAGDYCDLFSRWVKEWQSHREARWKYGSQKLDVAPSWLATSPSPDRTGQWRRREFALNPNNDAHNPSSVRSSSQRFFTGDSRLRGQFRWARPDPSACNLWRLSS